MSLTTEKGAIQAKASLNTWDTLGISVSTFPFNKQPVSVNTLKIRSITDTRRTSISKSTLCQQLCTGTEHFITDYLKVCVHLFPRIFSFRTKQCRECAHDRWPLYFPNMDRLLKFTRVTASRHYLLMGKECLIL